MNKGSLIALSTLLVGVFFLVYGSVLFGSIIITLGLLLQLKSRGVITQILPSKPSHMDIETKVLRFCIVGYWSILILTMFAGFYEEQGLPKEVVQFEEEEFDLAPLWAEWTVTISLVVFVLGSFGTFFLKGWGRRVFVLGYLGMTLVFPFFGSSVVTPVASILDEVGSVIIGVILCLLYLTPAKQHFD